MDGPLLMAPSTWNRGVRKISGDRVDSNIGLRADTPDESEKACAPHTVLHKQNLSASQLPTKAKPISQAPRALCPLANYPKLVSKMKENPVEKRGGTVLQKVYAGGFAQRNVAGSTLSKAASVRIPAGVATGLVVPKAGASSLARSNSLERVPEVKKREETTGSQHSKSVCENGSVSSSTSHLGKKGHLSLGSSSDKCKKKCASDTRAHFPLLPKENESDRCDPPKNIAVDVVKNGASSVKEKTNGVHPNESDNSVTRESDGKKNGHSAKSNSEEVNSKAFPVISNAQAAVSSQSNKALHEDEDVSKVCSAQNEIIDKPLTVEGVVSDQKSAILKSEETSVNEDRVISAKLEGNATARFSAFPVISNAQAAVSNQSNKALHEDEDVSNVCSAQNGIIDKPLTVEGIVSDQKSILKSEETSVNEDRVISAKVEGNATARSSAASASESDAASAETDRDDDACNAGYVLFTNLMAM
ncbi:hypothetical protein SK128_017014 [Halocaridina rubra]|uniref:Uncharacterized protein n=1 Tax=Halocaridina rubra TaxID=373956 RepID=A0AAN8XDK6_HALRR